MINDTVSLTPDEADRIGTALLVTAGTNEQRIATGYYGWIDLPQGLVDEITDCRDLARVCGWDTNGDGALVRRSRGMT